MGFIAEWLEGSSRPSTVKRDFSNDNTSYVECTAVSNRTFNWSYTFTVSEKIGASPKRSLGSWSITKQNYQNRASIEAQIEQAYYDAASKLQTSEERAEEETVAESTTTVQTQEVRGVIVTMERTENTLDIRGGEDATYYTVSTSEGQSRSHIDTQEEAEELFQYYLTQLETPIASTYEEEYRGVLIRFQDSNYKDGEDYISPITGKSMDSVFLSGEITEEFVLGSKVAFVDTYGEQEFGIITMDEDQDLEIIKAYIDARLDGRDAPFESDEATYGDLPIYSWGWYRDNNQDPNCPFSDVYLENVYTVSETNGRILGLTDDDFIAQGFESGLVKLKVKDGYRVRLKVMTQNRGFLEDNIPDLETVGMDFETYNILEASATNQKVRYNDTEKVKIDLFGGDEIQINIDGISGSPEVKKFYITQNGSQITSGGGAKINDETFLAVIEVERYEPQQNGGGGGGGSQTTTTTTGNAIPILIGGALILTILYMVLARGGEE
jgi:hypothetical protein